MKIWTLGVFALLFGCNDTSFALPAATIGAPPALAGNGEPSGYREAINLVHAYSGAGDELDRAMQTAEALSASHPQGGYGQALQAEMMSSWIVDQDGQPEEMVAKTIELADSAIKMNPKLALPHISKGRALVRASRYVEANAEISAALKVEPKSDSAFFLMAEVARRTGQFPKAEAHYREFIRLTNTAARKSNGYAWLGDTYAAAARGDQVNRAAHIANARKAYEQMVSLDPNGAWKLVNFAIFLNDDGRDYVEAEKYASRALAVMEFRMARNHLAVARYQQLLAKLDSMSDEELQQAVDRIYKSTGVTYNDAIDLREISTAISQRLWVIRDRLFAAEIRRNNAKAASPVE